MGFYGFEPFNNAEATYLWTGLNTPGVYVVTVEGDAPNFTYGISLQRSEQFVGGLKIDVMGWTGPVGQGSKAYKVRGSFPGQYHPEIVIQGSNGTKVIKVAQIPHTETDAFVKAHA